MRLSGAGQEPGEGDTGSEFGLCCRSWRRGVLIGCRIDPADAPGEGQNAGEGEMLEEGSRESLFRPLPARRRFSPVWVGG